MKIKINVRPRDTDSTSICSICPVAQALREAVGLEYGTWQNASRFDAFAQPTRLFAVGPKGRIMCDTPREVADRIREYDVTGSCDEFSFEVEMDSSRDRAPVNYVIPGAQPPTPRLSGAPR